MRPEADIPFDRSRGGPFRNRCVHRRPRKSAGIIAGLTKVEPITAHHVNIAYGGSQYLSRMKVFSELRNRGVLRVATVYLGASWLVIEVGHTLFNVFELPHVGLQLVFVLLALGLPFVLAAAWYYRFGAAAGATPLWARGMLITRPALPASASPPSPPHYWW